MNRRRWLRRGLALALLAASLSVTSAALAADTSYRCNFGGVQSRCNIPNPESTIDSKYRGYAKVKGASPCPDGAMCIRAGERQDAFTYYQHWVWKGGWVLQGDWYNSKRDGGTSVYVEPWTDGWVWTRTEFDWRTRSYDWMAMRADKLIPMNLSRAY